MLHRLSLDVPLLLWPLSSHVSVPSRKFWRVRWHRLLDAGLGVLPTGGSDGADVTQHVLNEGPEPGGRGVHAPSVPSNLQPRQVWGHVRLREVKGPRDDAGDANGMNARADGEQEQLREDRRTPAVGTAVLPCTVSQVNAAKRFQQVG